LLYAVPCSRLSISYVFFFLSKRILAAPIAVPVPLPFSSRSSSSSVYG